MSVFYKKHLIDAIKFSISGIISISVQFCVLAILIEFYDLNPTLSSGIGFILGLFANYFLLYYWTFPNNGKHHIVLSKYVSVMACAMLINISTFWVSITFIGASSWYIYAQMIATCCSSIFSFFMNRHYTFV